MLKQYRGLHLIAIVSVLAALSAGPQVARAQPNAGPSAPTTTFVVNSLGDAPDANLANPTCATAGAVCTFRAAVQQAGANAGADTITFSVTGSITLTDFTPFITDTLTIVGPGPALLTIDANSTGPGLWAFNPLTPLSLEVSGLTLTGGVFDEGGGVAFNGDQLVISNTVLTGNTGDLGGGLYFVGTAQVFSSTISNNTAFTRGGGIDAHGPLTVANSRLQANAVDPTAELLSVQGLGAYSGGGLFTSAQLTMTNSLVLSNTVRGPVLLASAAGAQPAAPIGPFGAGLYLNDTSAWIQGSVIAGNRGLGCITCAAALALGANPAGAPVSALFGYGGGVYAYASGLLMEDSQVLDNAAQLGGGLFLKGGLATFYLTLVADNRAEAGGGLNADNLFLAVNDSLLRDNWATSGNGGAVYGDGGNIQFNNTHIRHNRAGTHGGGLFIVNAALYIGFSQIEGNAAGEPQPLANAAFVEPQIVSDAGGGLSLYGSDTQIYNSAIVSNTATLGGGIDNASLLYIENSTISGNHADRDGGGLRLTMPLVAVAGGGGGVTAELLHVTLAGNVADADDNGSGNGGGLFVTVGTTATLHSTLLGPNVDNGGQAPECAGPAASTGYNLVELTHGCSIAPTTGDQFGVFSGVLPLANNGGATLTNALPLGSLAIDTADPDPNKCIAQDQRNFARPMGAGCDIGAFEWQARLYLPLLLR